VLQYVTAEGKAIFAEKIGTCGAFGGSLGQVKKGRGIPLLSFDFA